MYGARASRSSAFFSSPCWRLSTFDVDEDEETWSQLWRKLFIPTIFVCRCILSCYSHWDRVSEGLVFGKHPLFTRKMLIQKAISFHSESTRLIIWELGNTHSHSENSSISLGKHSGNAHSKNNRFELGKYSRITHLESRWV